jgi:hypothetical protein
MSKEFNIEALTSKINQCKKELKKFETEEKIKKYGTFFDSKQEIIQLYLLFMFFGVNQHTIQQFPKPYEYDVD